MITTLIDKFSKHDIKFKIVENTIIDVDLGLGLKCQIKEKEKEKIIILGRLTAWNFITGLIPIPVKWLLVYNIGFYISYYKYS